MPSTDVSHDDVDTSGISETATATSEDTFKAPPHKKRKLRTCDNSKLENQMNEAYNILIKKSSTQQKTVMLTNVVYMETLLPANCANWMK